MPISPKRPQGFTIIELLIVIVIIAILAAITLVAYNQITSRANDVAVQSDLKNFAKIMEMQKIDSVTSTYPAVLTAAMGFKFSEGSYGMDFQSMNVRYCYNGASDSYILMANSKSGNYFKAQNGVVSATAAQYGYNVCSQVGLTTTNPTQNGFDNAASPKWAAWVN